MPGSGCTLSLPLPDSVLEDTAPEMDSLGSCGKGITAMECRTASLKRDTSAAFRRRDIHFRGRALLGRFPQFYRYSGCNADSRDDDGQKGCGHEVSFVSGGAPLLIATTVIEVGVDVSRQAVLLFF